MSKCVPGAPQTPTRHHVMERTGAGAEAGLLFALNNAGDVRTKWVKRCEANKDLRPLALRGKASLFEPPPTGTNAEGWCEVQVPPRGYVVYGV